MSNTDGLEIRIAIGHRDDLKVTRQHFKGWNNFGKQFDVIANFVKDSECFVNKVRPVSCCRADPTENRMTEKGQVMRAICELHDDLRSNLSQVRWLVHLSNAWIILAEPFVQSLLGTLDHRMYRPEGVVKINCDGANVVHGGRQCVISSTIVNSN
jgi:hypothetical protein